MSLNTVYVSVHPEKILKNSTVREGDVLILTKALGTGILNTAIKADLLLPDTEKALINSMAALNKDAASAMEGFAISGCTDVTGFGLMPMKWLQAAAEP